MLAGSIAPLVVLAIAGAAFGNEVEDRTLANLTLSPVPRWQIALPKLLATVAIAGPFMAASAFLTAHIGYLGDARASLAVTVGAIAGVAMYAALFVWLGLRSTQAVGIGLVYIVLWEGFFTGFVAGTRLFSIRYYAMGVAHAIDPRRFATADILGPTAAVAATLLVLGGFFYLTTRQLRTMDVP
jgi:ABC-type transport system involved in multi-copper enzyme maturation permease subunit